MSDHLPWPAPGSSILEVGDQHLCANLKWAQGQWFGYEEGYRHAANLIFERIEESGTWLDSLVFPLAYLWRHAIELQLKKIIVNGAKLRDVEAAPHHHHKLAKLWQVAKVEIVALDDVAPDGSETVEHVLKELDELDPETTGWRFPQNRCGEPNLSAPPDALDLRNLHAVLTAVHTFLECGNTEISRRLDWRDEMEGEMARNCRD